MEHERRRSARQPVEGDHVFAFLQTDYRRVPVLVADESVHGLGVVAIHISESELPVGTPVRYESSVREVGGRVAITKHMNLFAKRIHFIGLEWDD